MLEDLKQKVYEANVSLKENGLITLKVNAKGRIFLKESLNLATGWLWTPLTEAILAQPLLDSLARRFLLTQRSL